MTRFVLRIAAAVAAVATIAGVASATPITRTYDINATDFKNQDILSSATPTVDPWHVVVTVTFDPAVANDMTPVDAFVSADLNGGDYGPYDFVYTTGNHQMQIGDDCFAGLFYCSLSGNDAILRLDLTNPDAPLFLSAAYRVTVGRELATFSTATGTVTVATGNPSVPEPSTLLLGMGALFLLGWKRQTLRGSAE